VQLWRVGRRRIAWRPRLYEPPDGAHLPLVAEDPPDPDEQARRDGHLFDRMGGWPFAWIPVLLATLVVWPWRARTGRWPVVAYTLGMADQPGYRYETVVAGRAEADGLARRWAEEIRRYGRPQGEPDEVMPDRTHLFGRWRTF
jgi:hypothetical protein